MGSGMLLRLVPVLQPEAPLIQKLVREDGPVVDDFLKLRNIDRQSSLRDGLSEDGAKGCGNIQVKRAVSFRIMCAAEGIERAEDCIRVLIAGCVVGKVQAGMSAIQSI